MHPDELPLASGYLPEHAIPLDRWVVTIIRLLPKKTQAKIAADADLTDVVRPLDLRPGVPGLTDWEAIHNQSSDEARGLVVWIDGSDATHRGFSRPPP